jgi:hypothetical protein
MSQQRFLVIWQYVVESSWNVMLHGDAREGKWRGNWRMEWVANTLHTTSEHGVSSITTADAHTSAASTRLNWRPRLFKWNRPFRRKTKSGFCACAITLQTQPTWGRSRWIETFVKKPSMFIITERWLWGTDSFFVLVKKQFPKLSFFKLQ